MRKRGLEAGRNCDSQRLKPATCCHFGGVGGRAAKGCLFLKVMRTGVLVQAGCLYISPIKLESVCAALLVAAAFHLRII